MRRRDVLAGLAGAATLGGGAYVLTDDGAADRVEPIELETVDAPGSRSGTTTIPDPGRVTFVELFATWCHVCQESMEPLDEASDRVGDDVQFVSVTNEPLDHAVTRAEIREWWADHDGRWPVAVTTTSR